MKNYGEAVKKAMGGHKAKKTDAKFEKVMHEWGKGQLHSGSKKGPVVKDQRQALAIAFSEARKGQ